MYFVYHISTTRGRRFLGLMPKFVVLQFLHSFTNMTPLDGENRSISQKQTYSAAIAEGNYGIKLLDLGYAYTLISERGFCPVGLRWVSLVTMSRMCRIRLS